jgi:hypothetical protein
VLLKHNKRNNFIRKSILNEDNYAVFVDIDNKEKGYCFSLKTGESEKFNN